MVSECGIKLDVEGRGRGRSGAGGAALAVEPEGISRLAAMKASKPGRSQEASARGRRGDALGAGF